MRSGWRRWRLSARDVSPMDFAITFLNGAHKGETLEFRGPRRLLVGRAEDVELPVLDQKVSRRHCHIVIRDDLVQVEDLGSVNGTFVNEARVSVQKLSTGDHLRLAE